MESILGAIGALVILALILYEYMPEEEEKVEKVRVVASLQNGDGETIKRKKHELSHEEYKKRMKGGS